ncbi:hypothetical protein [Dactylosporangium sp. CS-033363]|uniref:hypothetical protein n=1 Tax=Dactylosporangium sp. CS-033363 TaxID=3239935 RepID=UPI003D8F4CF9
MPPALVRPYVRVIPIAHIPPAPSRRSTVPIRTTPPAYRARHDVQPPAQPTAQPPQGRPRHTRRRRRGPALAWGALLVTLATTAITLRPGEEPLLSAAAPAADSAHLEIAMVPAPVTQAVLAASTVRRRPDAAPTPVAAPAAASAASSASGKSTKATTQSKATTRKK